MKRVFKQTIGLALGMLLLGLQATAQDGEALFKAKCSVCHMVDKNSTGPMLKGVKQKWNDAGEGDLLYKWVENPEGLIASGSSKMAAAIKDFSPSSMTPQQVSKEETDAILDYVDNYVKAEVAPPGPGQPVSPGGSGEVTVVPNYEENLQLFYFLLGITGILLLAIVMISRTTISFVKSDYFKSKMQAKSETEKEETNGSNAGGILGGIGVLIIGLGYTMFTNTSYALSFTAPGTSEEKSEWLLVENSDIYLMVIINVLLLFVLLYLRNMFNAFVRMTKTEEQLAKAAKATKKFKWNKVLTDAVPIEEEKDILMHHEYDGIQELDNNLPPWWVYGFYATIVFSVIYLFNYHVFRTSDLQAAEYDKSVAAAQVEIDAYKKKMAMDVDETNATLLTDASALASGKKLFDANCVVCHNPKGEGNIGPNLTDKHWIYGFDIKDVFKTIKLGAPNGMPEHASKLNPIEIQQVSSYVLELPETPGKEAQGDIIEK